MYSHSGKSNRFKLTVSLHERTGRTFVHASEEFNPSNIQVTAANAPVHPWLLGTLIAALAAA